MHVTTLIELAVQRLDRKSVRALAERMGIAHGILYEWKSGTKPIPDERIQQIARIAGQEPGPWLLLIHSEQDGGELGRTWAALAKQLGAVAMAVMLVVGLAFPALATSGKAGHNADSVYIMRNCWLADCAGSGSGSLPACLNVHHARTRSKHEARPARTYRTDRPLGRFRFPRRPYVDPRGSHALSRGYDLVVADLQHRTGMAIDDGSWSTRC